MSTATQVITTLFHKRKKIAQNCSSSHSFFQNFAILDMFTTYFSDFTYVQFFLENIIKEIGRDLGGNLYLSLFFPYFLRQLPKLYFYFLKKGKCIAIFCREVFTKASNIQKKKVSCFCWQFAQKCPLLLLRNNGSRIHSCLSLIAANLGSLLQTEGVS